jgi:hypothetical protein
MNGSMKSAFRGVAAMATVVLPLAACDKGPTTAEIRRAIVEEAMADKPLMRTLPPDQLMPELDVKSRTCASAADGTYKCSVLLSYMGQNKTVDGVFRKASSGWVEVH